MSKPIATKTIIEGTTQLVVPDTPEPSKFPSFFNPRGKFVRDVSIDCYNAYSSTCKDELVFADSLSGCGTRGIRVANEIGRFDVIINDISSTSIELAKKSANLNRIANRCKFSVKEICSFLSSREETNGSRFDIVDLDPFGTPSPFIDCALRSMKDGGLLSVSATDSGVLCGVYPSVALRKYQGLPLRTEYAHEVGLRLLFGLLSLTAMRLELSIEPLFCHHDMHYFRVYSKVLVGNKASRANQREIGYILHCFRCGSRELIARDELSNRASGLNSKCPQCVNSSVRFGGPLWIGKIQSLPFLAECRKISKLPLFEDELELPTYYDLSTIADQMGVRTPRILDVISKLNSIGRIASRTRLNPRSLRTDASQKEIQLILKELVH